MTARHADVYAALARASGVRWWRRLLTIPMVLVLWFVLAVALFMLVVTVAGRFGVAEVTDVTAGALLDHQVWDNGLALASIAAALPAVLMAVRLVQRRPPGTVSSVAGRVRWRLLGRCALLAVPTTAGALVVLAVTTPGSATDDFADLLPATMIAAGVVVAVLLTPWQAAAEEYIRGLLMQVAGRTWPGILLGGAVFTLAHGPSTVWGVLDLTLFSIVVGVLIARTGGLEPAIGLHVVWNTVGFVLLSAVPVTDPTASAGDADWQLFVADLLALPAYAALVLRVGIRSRTEPPRGAVGVPRLTTGPSDEPIGGRDHTAEDADEPAQRSEPRSSPSRR